MAVKVYIFFIISALIAVEAKKAKIEPQHPYVLKLKLRLNEETATNFVIDTFFASNDPENTVPVHCDITLNDIIKALPIKKTSTTDLSSAFQKLDITLTDDDIADFVSSLSYEELSSMGLSVGKIYKNVVKTFFKNGTADLVECLNILGIAAEFTTAYTFGTDQDMFDALKNANFSQNNLQEIGNIINTPVTLKELSNIFGVKKYSQIYLANFVNTKVAPLLLDNGLTKDNLQSFLDTFTLTLDNYKDSKTIKKCYSTLTKGSSLAVAVSDSDIITNDDTVVEKYLNLEQYTVLTAESVEDGGFKYTVSADNIDKSDNIIRIKIYDVIPSYVQQTNTYEGLISKLCSYITDVDDILVTQTVVANIVNDQLTISKVNGTVFMKSSPLICEQHLYGLASTENLNSVIFDDFEEVHKHETSILEDPVVASAIKEFFESIMVTFNPCDYVDCGNREDKEVSVEIQENNEDKANHETTAENEEVKVNEEIEENDANNNAEGSEDQNNVESETTVYQWEEPNEDGQIDALTQQSQENADNQNGNEVIPTSENEEVEVDQNVSNDNGNNEETIGQDVELNHNNEAASNGEETQNNNEEEHIQGADDQHAQENQEVPIEENNNEEHSQGEEHASAEQNHYDSHVDQSSSVHQVPLEETNNDDQHAQENQEVPIEENNNEEHIQGEEHASAEQNHYDSHVDQSSSVHQAPVEETNNEEERNEDEENVQNQQNHDENGANEVEKSDVIIEESTSKDNKQTNNDENGEALPNVEENANVDTFRTVEINNAEEEMNFRGGNENV